MHTRENEVTVVVQQILDQVRLAVVGKDEDGNTTITTPTETTGTQTTTTTGTGKADSTTDIKETEETAKGDKIDLDTELGKDRDKLTWGTESGDTLGGYTVYKVEGKDENSKELTLTKTDDTAPEKEMSAEDIAAAKEEN